MFAHMRHHILLLLLLLAPLLAAFEVAQVTPREGVAWQQLDVDQVSYVSWDQLCEQYGFRPDDAGHTPLVYRHHEAELRVAEDGKSIYLQGFRIALNHPILFLQGEPELISKHDCIYLLDPILRASYIQPTRPAQTVLINAPYGGVGQGDIMDERTQLSEATYTLRLSRKLAQRLIGKGVHCVLIRSEDQFRSEHERVRIANSFKRAIFVSLHVNQGHVGRSGIETYTVRSSNPHSNLLAMSLHTRLVGKTGARDGGLCVSHYSYLRSIEHPSCLLYLGYMSQPEEKAKLLRPEYQEKLLSAMEEGILNYIRLSEQPRVVELDHQRRALGRASDPLIEVYAEPESLIEQVYEEVIAEPEAGQEGL